MNKREALRELKAMRSAAAVKIKRAERDPHPAFTASEVMREATRLHKQRDVLTYAIVALEGRTRGR